MKKYPKYPIVVLCITLLLILTSLVMAFIGAFRGEEGDAFLKTGIAGLVIIPPLGWIMVAVYNRVHKDEQTVNDMLDQADSGEDDKADGSDEASKG
jgi:uncharacterized membrane protein